MNQEFAENIKNHIREYLPVDYQDAKIPLKKSPKEMTGFLQGLSSERMMKRLHRPFIWNTMRNSLAKVARWTTL